MVKMKLFDSHLHLADDLLFPNWQELFKQALDAGVEKFVVVATNREECERGLKMKERYPDHFFLAAAVTPHEAHKASEYEISFIEKIAREGKLDAIGETGLEYRYFSEMKEKQKALLKEYLLLAVELSLPVIIHCREAFEDFFKVLDSLKICPRGVLHCFTGSEKEMLEVVRRGFLVSFSGIVTYPKSEELRDVLKKVPLSHLLIETDAPFLSPQAHRGKQNEPAFLLDTASTVASSLGISLEEVSLNTYHNGQSLFESLKR